METIDVTSRSACGRYGCYELSMYTMTFTIIYGTKTEFADAATRVFYRRLADSLLYPLVHTNSRHLYRFNAVPSNASWVYSDNFWALHSTYHLYTSHNNNANVIYVNCAPRSGRCHRWRTMDMGTMDEKDEDTQHSVDPY